MQSRESLKHVEQIEVRVPQRAETVDQHQGRGDGHAGLDGRGLDAGQGIAGFGRRGDVLALPALLSEVWPTFLVTLVVIMVSFLLWDVERKTSETKS